VVGAAQTGTLQATDEVKQWEGRTAQLQKAVNALAYDKQRAEEASAALQRRAERYEAILSGEVAAPEEAGAALYELQVAQKKAHTVRTGITTLMQHHPELTDVLQRVQALLDVGNVEEAKPSIPHVAAAAAAAGHGTRIEERKADQEA
jgi:predicted  nucleic acid-binding Zn-ribbon protein